MTVTAPGPVTVGRATSLADALEPVRRALLEDAAQQARHLLTEARAHAEARVREARTQAEDAVREARRRARATADERTDRALAAARRDAHDELLRAETETWTEVVARLHRAVGTMPSDPRYPELLDALEALARDQLGDAATIDRDPDGGGIVATLAGRRVDYRLDALAERALDSIADRVAAIGEGPA